MPKPRFRGVITACSPATGETVSYRFTAVGGGGEVTLAVRHAAPDWGKKSRRAAASTGFPGRISVLDGLSDSNCTEGGPSLPAGSLVMTSHVAHSPAATYHSICLLLEGNPHNNAAQNLNFRVGYLFRFALAVNEM